MNTINRIVRIVIIAAGLLSSQALLAHNTLKATLPMDGAELDAAPEFIQLSFSDATYLEEIEVTDSHGNAVVLDFELPIETSAAFQVPLPRLEAGSYMVKWTIEGTDTHRLNGQFGFRIK